MGWLGVPSEHRHSSCSSFICWPTVAEVASSDEEDGDEDVGGLFKVVQKVNKKKKINHYDLNGLDCSKFVPETIQDWDLEEVSFEIQ